MSLTLLAATVLASSGISADAKPCSAYVGQKLQTVPFGELRASLPELARQGKYETTADYQKRLASAAPASAAPVAVRQAIPRESMVYVADRGELIVYARALGAELVNFADVFGYRSLAGSDDNFTGAIGFMVNVAETGTETYEATNGFGARFPVTRISRKIDTVWERPGKRGQSLFVDVKPYKPVAQFKVSAKVAEDLVEAGSSAILITPRAPYVTTGRSVVEATFSLPRERVDSITVILADIQCSFLLDGAGTVFAAFSVR